MSTESEPRRSGGGRRGEDGWENIILCSTASDITSTASDVTSGTVEEGLSEGRSH